jgi:DNA-binding PadR family transcriptional regulator
MHGFMHRHFGEHGRGGWGRHGGGMGGGGFMGGGPGGGGRRGRMFEQGALRLVTLRLLEEKPRHGYEIIKAVESFGGAYAPSPGIVYPTLTLLEELGYARVASEAGGKKLYEITDEGRAHLTENQALADGIFARMDAAKRAFGGGPPPQIIRAMENLRLAGRLKLQKGDLSEAQITAIADVLDDAAKKIESL